MCKFAAKKTISMELGLWPAVHGVTWDNGLTFSDAKNGTQRCVCGACVCDSVGLMDR